MAKARQLSQELDRIEAESARLAQSSRNLQRDRETVHRALKAELEAGRGSSDPLADFLRYITGQADPVLLERLRKLNRQMKEHKGLLILVVEDLGNGYNDGLSLRLRNIPGFRAGRSAGWSLSFTYGRDAEVQLPTRSFVGAHGDWNTESYDPCFRWRTWSQKGRLAVPAGSFYDWLTGQHPSELRSFRRSISLHLGEKDANTWQANNRDMPSPVLLTDNPPPPPPRLRRPAS